MCFISARGIAVHQFPKQNPDFRLSSSSLVLIKLRPVYFISHHFLNISQQPFINVCVLSPHHLLPRSLQVFWTSHPACHSFFLKLKFHRSTRVTSKTPLSGALVKVLHHFQIHKTNAGPPGPDPCLLFLPHIPDCLFPKHKSVGHLCVFAHICSAGNATCFYHTWWTSHPLSFSSRIYC